MRVFIKCKFCSFWKNHKCSYIFGKPMLSCYFAWTEKRCREMVEYEKINPEIKLKWI